jgi:hypothetical protein
MKKSLQSFKFLFVALLFHCALLLNATTTVYLLHGHGASKLIMNKLEKDIAAAGFETCNYGYRSVVDPIEKTGSELYNELKNSETDTVCFVTHSMGALVVRAASGNRKAGEPFPVVYRIVMIALPNKGAEAADFYASMRFFRWLLGPNLERMQTGPESFASNLPIPDDAEISIIAGIKGNGKGYNRRIAGEDDGRLKPESALLGLEREMATVCDGHSRLPRNDSVIEMTLSFLIKGTFRLQNINF